MAFREFNNEFLQLIPKGTGFEPAEQEWHTEPDTLDLEIQKKRQKYLDILGIKSDNMTTVYDWEKSAISKAKYILGAGNQLTRQQIHILIADRGLLFNRKYQYFNSDNHYYKQERKKIEQNVSDSSLHFKDAILQIPKTFHPTFSNDERDKYLQWKTEYNNLNTLVREASPFSVRYTSEQQKSIIPKIENILQVFELSSYSENKIIENKSESIKKVADYYKQLFYPHRVQMKECLDSYASEMGKQLTADASPMLISLITAFCNAKIRVKMDTFLPLFSLICARYTDFLFFHKRSKELSCTYNSFCKELFNLREAATESYIRSYRFLSELIEIYQLSPEERQKCWNVFEWLVFNEEPRLFENEYEKLKTQYEYLSPTAKYLVTAIKNINQCMDPEPQHLSGYHVGSLLHKGGFAKFLNQYPMTVPNVIKRVESSDELQKLQKDYQHNDSKPVYRLDMIRQMFTEEVLQSFRLTGISTEETNSFFLTLAGKSLTKRELEKNRNELKALLAELSFREYYIQEAGKVLLRAFLY